jgi:hypothetical protein
VKSVKSVFAVIRCAALQHGELATASDHDIDHPMDVRVVRAYDAESKSRRGQPFLSHGATS